MKFQGGDYAPDMTDFTKMGHYMINEVHETTGDVRRVLGHHGVRAIAGFEGMNPIGDFRIFKNGGLLELNPGAYADANLKRKAARKVLIDISAETGLGRAGFKLTGTGSSFPASMGLIPEAYFKKNDLGNAISNAVGGIRIEDGGFIDPELRTLMTELIQTVRDKEMGVNIYNDTGQNMQLDDGEGEGFDESSYRETINLA